LDPSQLSTQNSLISRATPHRILFSVARRSFYTSAPLGYREGSCGETYASPRSFLGDNAEQFSQIAPSTNPTISPRFECDTANYCPLVPLSSSSSSSSFVFFPARILNRNCKPKKKKKSQKSSRLYSSRERRRRESSRRFCRLARRRLKMETAQSELRVAFLK
jgi:hypothetical protein